MARSARDFCVVEMLGTVDGWVRLQLDVRSSVTQCGNLVDFLLVVAVYYARNCGEGLKGCIPPSDWYDEETVSMAGRRDRVGA